MFLEIIIYDVIIYFDDIALLEHNIYNIEEYFKLYFLRYDSAQNMNLTTYVIFCSGILIFPLMYGNYIYKDISPEGIYVFTRQKSRKIWYIKKIYCLFILSLIFSLFTCIIDFLIIYINVSVFPFKSVFPLFFGSFIIKTVTAFSLCTLQNILSGFCGQNISLIFVSALFLLESFNSHYIISNELELFPYIYINPVITFTVFVDSQITTNLMTKLLVPLITPILLGTCIFKMNVCLNDKDV